jgi:hypothetical protein
LVGGGCGGGFVRVLVVVVVFFVGGGDIFTWTDLVTVPNWVVVLF